MMTDPSFRYVHLTSSFYQDFSWYKETMKNPDRQYLHLVAQHRGHTFVIPFRSEINHRYCFKFSPNNNKGLDYSKAIIIQDMQKYAVPSAKPIPQYQHDLIVRKEATILRKFYKYVDDYCKAVQNNDTNVLNRIGKYSSLMNFHNELGI
jgi:protein AbiQ